MDECEFKVSVLGQRRLEKNRSPGFVLEPNCAEIMHYNIAGEKLKAVIEHANINHVHITTLARMGLLQLAVTWYMLEGKLPTGTSKTKGLHQDKFEFSLFWMSQWAACPPACTM